MEKLRFKGESSPRHCVGLAPSVAVVQSMEFFLLVLMRPFNHKIVSKLIINPDYPSILGQTIEELVHFRSRPLT